MCWQELRITKLINTSGLPFFGLYYLLPTSN